MEIYNCINARCCAHQTETEKEYGENVWKMIKAAPLKSAHLCLRDVVEGRWASSLFGGAFVWTLISIPLLPILEAVRKAVPGCGVSDYLSAKFALDAITIITHSLGWLCGQLFGDAFIGKMQAAAWYQEKPKYIHR